MADIFGSTQTQHIDTVFDDIASSYSENKKLTEAARFFSNDLAISQISIKEYLFEPLETDDYCIYFYGSIYNFKELQQEFNISAANLINAIAEGYAANKLDIFLNKTNGKFNGCIYDKKKKTISLFVDRFGMHFFYYYHENNTFTFASYLETLLKFKNLNLEIDKNAVLNYYTLMTFIEDNTWFEHIKTIKPASILEYNLNNNTLTQRYYWKFSEIKPQNLSYRQARDKLIELFIQSVKRRLNPEKKTAIPISGGRDSRMFVAAIYIYINSSLKTYNYTFGTKNCGDIIIAKEICKLAGQEHHSYYFQNDEKDITKSRYKALLKTSTPIHSLHGCEFSGIVEQNFSEVIHGYPAGEIFSVIISGAQDFINQKYSYKIHKYFFPNFQGELKDLESDFYNINHFEAYYLANIHRRFGANNTFHSEMNARIHNPYIDNDIIELIFSIPDEYRLRGLYPEALVKAFPQFYKMIPWQETGYPCWLDKPNKKLYSSKLAYRYDKIIRNFYRKQYEEKYKNKYPDDFQGYFFDYTGNLKDPELVEKYKKMLDPQTAEYAKYTSENLYEKYYLPLLEGKTDHYYEIFNIISAELYLKYIKELQNNNLK